MSEPVRLLIVILCAVFTCSIAARSAPAYPIRPIQGAPTSARQGVYSAEQAGRGRALFKGKCAACHPTEFFTDGVFLATWNGQTAHALFTTIRTTMPQESPGSLRRQEYADVLAYLFQLNKLPAGRAELPTTDDGLKKVVIETPAKR